MCTCRSYILRAKKHTKILQLKSCHSSLQQDVYMSCSLGYCLNRYIKMQPNCLNVIQTFNKFFVLVDIKCVLGVFLQEIQAMNYVNSVQMASRESWWSFGLNDYRSQTSITIAPMFCRYVLHFYFLQLVCKVSYRPGIWSTFGPDSHGAMYELMPPGCFGGFTHQPPSLGDPSAHPQPLVKIQN